MLAPSACASWRWAWWRPRRRSKIAPASQLEAQLQAFDRGANDPGRADQIRRYEEAAAKQQSELDRTLAQSRQASCEGGFFLFNSPSPQCPPLQARIQQQRANLERVQTDLCRLQSSGGNGPEREGQRRAILVALAQNDCGPQYRQAAAAPPPRSGGLFESLFGPGSVFSGGGSSGSTEQQVGGGGYRTVCVRSCDGYYYPISFSTTRDKFQDDERTCQRSCPAAEVTLYSHRNPGEGMNEAVSLGRGSPTPRIPSAFKYRQAFNSSCSCRRPGESWAQTMKQLEDQTVERGDIVVNDERARQMSQPRTDAQGRPIRPEPRSTRPDPRAAQRSGAPPPPAATAPPADAPAEEPEKRDPNRPVRAVGPTFYSVR